MKTKYIFIAVALFCSTFCFAQDKLINKYADMDGVTSVYISKAMFQMMGSIAGSMQDMNGLDLQNMAGKLESLQVLKSEKQSVREQMKKDFTGTVNAEFEELMKIRSESTVANFYIQQSGDIIRDLLMLTDTEGDFIVIRIKGNFTMQDIQDMAGKMQ